MYDQILGGWCSRTDGWIERVLKLPTREGNGRKQLASLQLPEQTPRPFSTVPWLHGPGFGGRQNLPRPMETTATTRRRSGASHGLCPACLCPAVRPFPTSP